MSTELKPCSFCGGKPSVWGSGMRTRIGCNNPLCAISVHAIPGENAAKEWNTRAPQHSADIDAMRTWQPIETAPKDGEIWAFNGEQARIIWSEGVDWARMPLPAAPVAAIDAALNDKGAQA